MNEDKIREIVKAVVSQMTIENNVSPKGNTGDRYTANSSDDSCIEDITSEEYKKKLLVKNPKDEKAYKSFKESTPARIGVGRAGDRPLTETIVRFRADHASAIDSVFSTVNEKLLDDLGLIKLQTKIVDKDNMKDILPAFIQGLNVNGIKAGTPVFIKYGRVGVMDAIGEELGAEAAIIFIGERPGLVTAESMSAYMVYNPRRGLAEAERTVVSNIHKGGTPPVEAGAHLATLVKRMLDAKASGINLQK